MLYRNVRNSSERTLKRLEQKPTFLANWSASEYLRRCVKKVQYRAKRNYSSIMNLEHCTFLYTGNFQCKIIVQESQSNNSPSSLLAALLFMNAADSFTPVEVSLFFENMCSTSNA